MTSFAERFTQKGVEEGMQQGMQQGIQQGMRQGMRQGEAKVLSRQLQLKFGELPDDVRTRIETADNDTLLAWTERVLTAATLDEVFC